MVTDRSAKRRRALEALSQYPFGRGFILNFAYCEKKSLFHSRIDRALILDQVADRLNPIPFETQIISIINECLGYYYHQKLSFDQEPAFKVVEKFYRVTPFSRLMSKQFPLLSSEAVAEFGYLSDDRVDPSALRQFASDVLSVEWIASRAVICGRHPFAWATATHRIDELLTDLLENEDRVGKAFCQLLALEGFKEEDPLFLLLYPPDAAGLDVRRPTAFDGFGNAYFKARTEQDDEIPQPRHGFTLDISQVPNFAKGIDPVAAFDGLPEYAAVPRPLTPQFGLFWIGNFRAAWVYCEEETLDSIISGTYEPARALGEAMDFLVDL